LINKIEIGKNILVQFEFRREQHDHKDLESHHELVVQTANFINENREDLKLLIFKSEGSSFTNYTDELTKWFARDFKKSLCDQEKNKLDSFFVHITTSIWIHAIEDALLHDIQGERFIGIAEDLMTFVFSGWQKVVETKGFDCH